MALKDHPILYRGTIAVVLLAALGLSACGRKGDLEPPPASTTTSATDPGATDGATADAAPADAAAATTADAAAAKKKKDGEKPSGHFFLDPLL